MKRIVLFVFISILGVNLCGAQGLGYDRKIDIGNGLYKVKSGDYYGIIDEDDNVKVSIEFQDLLFKNGKALLTKNDVLYGVVDSLGNTKMFEPKYKIHPKYRYVYDGYIVVSNIKMGFWSFISEDGVPFRLKSKIKGVIGGGKLFPSMFFDVSPFVDGIAAVYLNKEGWKHIDKSGTERFLLGGKKVKALFRSSVHNGECVIVTDEGIKQYQENYSSQAVVKRVLSSSATSPIFIKDYPNVRLSYVEGVLTLDSLMRVSKFETGQDSIIFIEKPRKVEVVVVEEEVVAPVEEILSLKECITASIVYKNIQANENGRAYTEIKLENISEDTLEELYVVLESAGAKREWKGSLKGGSEIKLSFNVPARFSTETLKRNISIQITHKEDSLELESPVTIKRYNPVRSR